MILTFFSFIMSVLWSSIIILFVHFLRKKQFFLNGFGITTIILLYAFSIGRMLLAVEFPFTKVVPIPKLYNPLVQEVYLHEFTVRQYSFNLFKAFLLVWFAVSLILLLSFIIRYIRASKVICSLNCSENKAYQVILNDIKEQLGSKMDVQVMNCYGVTLPMGIGLRSKRILIPPTEYTDEQIRYILLHEYMHFRNKDLQIKLLAEIFVRIFWWNPLVYLLRADICQILEIKCDMAVTVQMNSVQRAAYLRTITACITHSRDLKALRVPAVSTQLAHRNSKYDEMRERFILVAHPVAKKRTIFQIASIVCVILIFFLSYTIIFQSAFETPQEEIYTCVGVEESGTLSGYILARKDGTYTFIDETGFEMEISKETVEIFVSDGYEMREE